MTPASINPTIHRAYKFFRARGHRASYAIVLARAESYASANDLRCIWEYDDLSLSDVWDDHDTTCDTYRRAKYEHEQSHQYSCRCLERACNHEILGCMLATPCNHGSDFHASDTCENPLHGDILESTWGIIDPSSAYRREVEAELTANYLANIRHAWSTSDHITRPLHALA